MNIDRQVVDQFIENRSDKNIREHWIYGQIVQGSNVFDRPDVVEVEEYLILADAIESAIKTFRPSHEAMWEALYGAFNEDHYTNTILLILGAPEPYDAFVRVNEKDEMVIVFDIKRLLQYKKHLRLILNQLLTHELCHIENKVRFDLYKEGIELETKLKQILFDEAFAHYIADPRLHEKNTAEENHKYQEHAYRTLHRILDEEITEEVIERGQTGAYWEKCIPISGYFLIVDYVEQGGRIEELYKEGYEAFWQRWLKAYVTMEIKLAREEYQERYEVRE